MPHTIHPLAGQGFNLSIEDCFDLLKCINKASAYGKDLGDVSILKSIITLEKKKKLNNFNYDNNFLSL